MHLPSAHTLAQFHSGADFNLDLLHYPALSTSLLRSGAHNRISAHSDFGTLTLLFQDNVGGLEIAEPNSTRTASSAEAERVGRFRHVEPIAGTVVVNVGYLLMRWSNGRWKSTIHRVVEPPIERTEEGKPTEASEANGESINGTSPERYSIPFFAAPDPATTIEALPGCWSESMPKKWQPINAGDYLRKKRGNLYT